MRHLLALLPLVVACGEPADSSDTDTDSPIDTDVIDDEAPLIDEALACGRAAQVGGLADGTELRRIDLDPDEHPDALCNDGTPGFYYLREAATEQARDHWVVQLQGGGGCRDAASCLARWCSVGTRFGMTQMTADLSPADGIDGKGLLSRRPENPLGDANQVFIRYCSSDAWQGQRSDVVLTGPHPETGQEITARVHFRGASIVDAVFDELEQEHGLADATSLVLAGASAGAAGVATHAEGITARLRALSPEVDVAILHDSNFRPAASGLDYDATPLCTEQELCDWESHFRWERDEGSIALRSARLDASCQAFHGEDDWPCADLGHVVRHHITEPMMMRTSQRDELLTDNTVGGGWAVDGTPLDEHAYAEIVRDESEDLARGIETAEEGEAFELAPAVFVPTCPKHETLGSERDTFVTRVDAGGRGVSMLELFSAWRRGEGPRVAITRDPSRETCP